MNEETFDKTERYLMGKMDVDEYALFQLAIKADAQLREEVTLQLEMMEAAERAGMKRNLENIHVDLASTQIIQSENSRGQKWIPIAAAIIVLVGITAVLLTMEPNKDKLFSEYVTTDPGLPVPMSATDSYDFHDAMVDYKAEKYDLAIEKWSALLENEPTNDTLIYYISSAHFNASRYTEASEGLKEIASRETSIFSDKAEWYLALCQLKLGRWNELKAISPSTDSKYRDRIVDIQKRTDEI